MSDFVTLLTHNTATAVVMAALIARGAFDAAVLCSALLRSLVRDVRAALKREQREWKSAFRK